MKKYDAIIIGFGKGGKTLAGALGTAGIKTALIEKSEQMYGGTCINVGCIPSKSFVHSSEISDYIGGSFEEKSLRYTEAVKEKERLTAMLRKKNFDKLNSNPNITIFNGTASFTGSKQVSVTGKDTVEQLEADKIFINTGSGPFIPPIPGLKESKYCYVSETLLSLDKLPKHLIIIGGGYIGMEFASIYRNFGSEVTVIQDGPVFLPREDVDIAAEVKNSLISRGIRIFCSTEVKSVADKDGQAAAIIQTEKGTRELTADAILIATGRRPNTRELHPEYAGVELTERGGIKTDELLRTTAKDIWAMGDVTGGLQFTYISLDDYRIVQSQVLGNNNYNTLKRGTVPYSVFLNPPFSRTGLSEKEAISKGYDIKIAKLPAAAIPKAQVLKNTTGLLKVIIDAKTEQILGAHLFCAESHEMINLIKLAMDAGLSYTVLRDSIYTHPTMSEAFNDLFTAI